MKQLTNKEIAESLLNDAYSYSDTIKHLLIKALDGDKDNSIYWDAWFRGAEGKDLINADNGIIFIE